MPGHRYEVCILIVMVMTVAMVLAMKVTYEPEAPSLVINEISVHGQTADLSVKDNNGEACDWIELYNPTDQTVTLEHWFLTDDPTEPYKVGFGPQTSVPAYGYLIVYCSRAGIAREDITTADIGIANGETIRLTSDEMGIGHAQTVTVA